MRTFAGPLLISAALVLPFVGLQLVNRRTFDAEFPYVLFAFMSLHSLLIVFSITRLCDAC